MFTGLIHEVLSGDIKIPGVRNGLIEIHFAFHPKEDQGGGGDPDCQPRDIQLTVYLIAENDTKGFLYIHGRNYFSMKFHHGKNILSVVKYL